MVKKATSGNAFQKTLAELERSGLGAPANVTLKRHLNVLVDAGLVPDDVAARFVEAHDEAGFSRSQASRDNVGSTCTQLLAILKRRSEQYPQAAHRARRILDEMAPAAIHTRQAVSKERPEPDPPEHEPLFEPTESLLEVPTPEPSSPLRSSSGAHDRVLSIGSLEIRFTRRQKIVTITSLVLIGAITAVSIGYAAHDRIAWGLHVLTSHVLDLPFNLGSSHGHLDQARRLAAENPSTIGYWRQYADQSERGGRPAETVVARRRLISLQPNNAQALNELAWMLVTSEELSIRDPIQALELAERAYVLNQSPAITDTLAEAAFQNGQLARAVVLAEEALAKVRNNDAYYRRQLERFRAAAGKETAAAEVADIE